METWPEMKARHRRERMEAIQCLADDYTLSEAARILDVQYLTLVRLTEHYGIEYKHKYLRK